MREAKVLARLCTVSPEPSLLVDAMCGNIECGSIYYFMGILSEHYQPCFIKAPILFSLTIYFFLYFIPYKLIQEHGIGYCVFYGIL